ncbi:MAG: hypothetical protein P9L88_03530 [Candidatus Tantalella remota]|nr:hypothetical protein [Candidatus Tantalella remota]
MKKFFGLRMFSKKKKKEGFVLIMTLGIVLLMSTVTLSFATLLAGDVALITHIKLAEQAKNAAEGGVNHALAKLKADGFDSRSDFQGSLSTGTYEVTYVTIDGRTLLTSVGTSLYVSKTVSVEIRSNFPSALTKMFAGANDVKARATSSSSQVSIKGDIHANNDVEIRAMGSGVVSIDGVVSATGIVQEGSAHNASDSNDTDVFIDGSNNDGAVVYEGEPRVTFPVFNLSKYKQEAIDSGDYYSGNKQFNNVTLTPASGAIYVDGNVKFKGECILNGGIIGDDIDVMGELTQVHTGDRNIILAVEKDILVNEGLFVEEAIVSAARDVRTRAAGTWLDVTGCILAGRDMTFWNVQTNVKYTHKLTYPSDLLAADGDAVIIESWMR